SLLLLPAMLFGSSACLQIPELEADTTQDAGSQDSSPVTVNWLSPGPPGFTNGTLQIRVEVTGPAPERVELLVDGVPVAPLSALHALDWETWLIPEGPHVLAVRATRGAQAFMSTERTVVVDRTRPRMTLQRPAHGEAFVSPGAAIEAAFSEPLLPSSVSRQSIRVTANSAAVAAEVSLSGDGKTLTILPDAPPPVNSEVTVSLDPTVTDLAGNSVDAMYQEWRWRVPAYLTVGEPLFAGKPENSYIEKASLRVGADSRPIVVWSQHGSVHVNRWSGEAWKALGEPLRTGATHIAWDGVLQIDREGRPLVMWMEFPGEAPSQLHVQRWDGAAWTSLGTFQTASLGGGAIFWMGFSSGASGAPMIAWRESNSTQHQFVFRKWDGSAWVAGAAPLPLRMSTTINASGFDLDSAGRPVLSFSENDSQGGLTGHVVRWNGSVWEDVSSGLAGIPWARAVHPDGSILVGVSALVQGQWRPLVQRWDGSAWLTVG
ncbi:MAG: hypothetical protein EOO70_06565, partial [Myxococcaceae bacterium]